jgi:hypothetical protein
MRMLRAAAVAGLLAGALLARPAYAAPTVHFEEPELCFEDGYGTTTCTSSVGQYNTTITPSGDEHLQGKGVTTYSVVSPSGSLYDTREYNITYFRKAGELHVFKEQSIETFVIDGRICNLKVHYHFANGRTQFDRPQLICEPE